eukprot:SAG11_NODE_1030_length_6119_cov_7.559302_10_plen_58_part_00
MLGLGALGVFGAVLQSVFGSKSAFVGHDGATSASSWGSPAGDGGGPLWLQSAHTVLH